MSSTDQLLLARISGICSCHCARGQIDDVDAAVRELRAVAGDRPDLLSQHAGVSMGLAEHGAPLLAPRHWAESDLCIAAGADQEQLPAWIEVGKERAEAMKHAPYTGGR